MPPLPDRGPFFSVLDYAPGFALYALHVPYSLYLAAKYRSWLLPALSNPSILTGGLAGESKTDLYTLVGPYARKFFAPFITVHAGDAPETFRERLNEKHLEYPLVAKPDIGRNGRGVRVVENETELVEHLSSFPADVRMVLQKFIADTGEAGVFYIRKPSETHGRITSLTLKYFPSVKGDGISTLRELIMHEPRPNSIRRLYLRRNKRFLNEIIPKDETHRIASVGNYIRGSIFADGADFITPEMTAAFDRISKDIEGFYYGRFDVRFSSIDDLKRGEGFTLIEFNGASSEPTHVYAPRMGLWPVYRDVLSHWRLAYEIGAENRDRGMQPVSLWTIWKVVRDESKLIRCYPDEE